MLFSTAGIEEMEPHRQPRADDQPGQRNRVGRAAHVLLHQPHAARRLDVEPAAVEAHALADDRDARGIVGFPQTSSIRRGARSRDAPPPTAAIIG